MANNAAFGLLSFSVFTDVAATGGAQANYATAPFFQTNLMRTPPGDHVNPLRVPGLDPEVFGMKVERTLFTGDSDPTFGYLLDEISGTLTAPTVAEIVQPPRHVDTTTYRTRWIMVRKTGHRVLLRITAPSNEKNLEIQTLGFVFAPDLGV